MNRALGQPRGNHAPQTPLPPPIAVDESQLTYKPSKLPWVKLLFTPSEGNFVQGQSVQIYDIAPMYRTPSAGPRPDIPPSDSDTLYRFRQRAKVITYRIVTIGPINHRDLLPVRPLSNGVAVNPGPRAYVATPEHVYYLKNRETVRYEGKDIPVPKHAGVTLQFACSRSKRPVVSTGNLESLYYIVQVHIETEDWKYTNGVSGCPAGSLVPVGREKQANIDKCTLKRPQYADPTGLDVYLRLGNAASFRTIPMVE